MIVLDTHARLWWQPAEEKLSLSARDESAAAKRIGVCTIRCYEVVRASRHGRIRLDRDADTWVTRALAADRAEALELTGPIAVDALRSARRSPAIPWIASPTRRRVGMVRDS